MIAANSNVPLVAVCSRVPVGAVAQDACHVVYEIAIENSCTKVHVECSRVPVRGWFGNMPWGWYQSTRLVWSIV